MASTFSIWLKCWLQQILSQGKPCTCWRWRSCLQLPLLIRHYHSKMMSKLTLTDTYTDVITKKLSFRVLNNAWKLTLQTRWLSSFLDYSHINTLYELLQCFWVVPCKKEHLNHDLASYTIRKWSLQWAYTNRVNSWLTALHIHHSDVVRTLLDTYDSNDEKNGDIGHVPLWLWVDFMGHTSLSILDIHHLEIGRPRG